jgi:hypothetical protein
MSLYLIKYFALNKSKLQTRTDIVLKYQVFFFVNKLNA